MQPYYQDDHVTLYHGDCREILPGIEFDAVVTDPPYGINAEYRPHGVGSGVVEWDATVPFDVLASFGEVPVIWFGGAPNLVEVLPKFDPPPSRLLVWAPKFTLALAQNNGIAYRFHPIYTWRLRKQSPAVHDVFTDATPCGTWWDHPATKPEPLMRRLVAMTDGTVLDSFAGSGSTLRAAKDLGRKAIGVELEERYCEIAANRLGQEVLAL